MRVRIPLSDDEEAMLLRACEEGHITPGDLFANTVRGIESGRIVVRRSGDEHWGDDELVLFAVIFTVACAAFAMGVLLASLLR